MKHVAYFKLRFESWKGLFEKTAQNNFVRLRYCQIQVVFGEKAKAFEKRRGEIERLWPQQSQKKSLRNPVRTDLKIRN